MEKGEGTVRLNKYLAECGVCSRRDGDKLIASGKVTVDGRVAVMGERVTGAETIAVQGKILQGRNQKIVLAYYKPVGVTCTERDRHAEKTVTSEIGYPVRVTYAGRLDKDSEGLLLLSNDGELIRRMMKASEKHEGISCQDEAASNRRLSPKDGIRSISEGAGCDHQTLHSGTDRQIYVPDHSDTGSQQADPEDVWGTWI